MGAVQAEPSPQRRRGPWTRAALAGVLAAGLALAAGELFAGSVSGGPSLAVAVGNLVIDLVPEGIKELAIRLFGTNDKLVLITSISVLALVLGGLLGLVAMRRIWVAAAGFAAFGIVGAVAGARSPQLATEHAALAGALAAATGIWALALLTRLGRAPAPAGATAEAMPVNRKGQWSRRGFLQGAVALGAVAAAAAAGGRVLLERARIVAANRTHVVLPSPAEVAATVPAEATVDAPGINPVVTPNDVFYRIDTALVIPHVDLAEWGLRITGMVERPYELSFNELLRLPMVERYITICCVSNEVGGDLIGNAKWLGVPLRTVLEHAGVKRGATQIVGRSVDGFTVGFPTELAFDGREALVAVGMNGEPLPFEHGFPTRIVVAGVYGYVSATKWLSEIELTTLEAFDAYWIPRGWAKQAPIKTQSRIDVPARLTVPAGRQPVAGVAWAQNRGIAKVEVQIDDAPWAEARLARAISKDTWVQWVYDWDARPGEHTLRVRATDATGQTQTAFEAPPPPDGATGYHTRNVRVA